MKWANLLVGMLLGAAGVFIALVYKSENKREVLAQCWVEFAKANKDQIPSYPQTKDKEEAFIANCIQAHGFERASANTGCSGERYYTMPDCYEPYTIENKIRRWIER